MTYALHGPSSDGLMMAQFPLVMQVTKGFSVTKYGKFHEPKMSATPRGSYLMALLAGVKMIEGSHCTSFMYLSTLSA